MTAPPTFLTITALTSTSKKMVARFWTLTVPSLRR
jgi:hypothetical protein